MRTTLTLDDQLAKARKSAAHVAALAIENGVTIASTDNDLRRFAGA